MRRGENSTWKLNLLIFHFYQLSSAWQVWGFHSKGRLAISYDRKTNIIFGTEFNWCRAAVSMQSNNFALQDGLAVSRPLAVTDSWKHTWELSGTAPLGFRGSCAPLSHCLNSWTGKAAHQESLKFPGVAYWCEDNLVVPWTATTQDTIRKEIVQ